MKGDPCLLHANLAGQNWVSQLPLATQSGMVNNVDFVSLVEEGRRGLPMAFGSQCAVSTAEQSSPYRWNLAMRKGVEGCGSSVGYNAWGGGTLTVTKQQGSEPSVA